MYVCLLSVAFGLLILQVDLIQSCSTSESDEKHLHCNQTKCVFELSTKSIEYFRSRLTEEHPKFIKFEIRFNDTLKYNATPDTFEPNQWVWTYNSSRGMNPYLYWNVDFGVLSFGLLDAKTLREHPFVYLYSIHKNCSIVFGTRDTTKALACAFEKLLANFSVPKYHNSYYCFLAERPGVRNTLQYKVAQYFLYPVDFINYNCCITEYNYTGGMTINNCLENQIQKWPQCTILPYILGIILFLYFPILMLKAGDGLSEDVTVTPQEYELIGLIDDSSPQDKDWVFLNETTPYSIVDFLSEMWCGLNKSHPILVSRIKRFFFTLMVPMPVLIQLLLYSYSSDLHKIKKFVKHGVPMGFLSLLADKPDRDKYFVPAFGGGVNILIAYGVIGMVIVVLPYSLKQILEDGIPKSSNTFCSPLCLGAWEIQHLSNIPTKSKPGYGDCANYCKCAIYALFSFQFWVRVFAIQYNRFDLFLYALCNSRTKLYVFTIILLPFYILICFVEVCFCLIWYGIPFFRFIYFLVRGATITLVTFKLNSNGSPKRLSLFIRNPIVFGFISLVLFSMSVSLTYTYSLIFIQSFVFMAQVVVFCFVAVIVYPAISFGYLFFFIMLLYYIFHMIRAFGDDYLTLLSEAVEISRNLDSKFNYVTTFGNTLEISNIRAHGIKQIKIEGKPLCFPQNLFQFLEDTNRHQLKIRMKNNTYGIPKRLFHMLRQKHKPPNQQVLKIVFQLVLITLLLTITMSITARSVTGPTNEISEVMHVLFIITIGALPRVLEVAMTTTNESVKREIDIRQLEQTIARFWRKEEMVII